MTRETFMATPSVLIDGPGPYEVTHPYREGSLVLYAVGDEVSELLPSDYGVQPVASDDTGAVTLTAQAAATYAGETLYIRRATVVEQGWQGQSNRELGLTAQLDFLTEAIQDVAAQVSRSVRGFEPVGLGDLRPGTTLAFDQNGDIAVGPTADQITQAQGHAVTAQQAAAEAATAANAALTVAAPYATRAAAVTALAGLPAPVLRVLWIDPAGKIRGVVRSGGSTDIPDMPGWIPDGAPCMQHFGGAPTATPAANAAAFHYLQLHIGTGLIELGGGIWTFGASPDPATYENGGTYLPASNACLVLRPGISLRGHGQLQTIVLPETQDLQAIYAISPYGTFIQDLFIDGQWDLVTPTSRSGILNVVPSDADLSKLIDNNFEDGTIQSWQDLGGDFAASNVTGGDLRCNFGPTYGGLGYVSKTIPTEIGKEYRVRVMITPDPTVPNPEYITVSASNGGIGGRYFSQTIGEPISTRFAATVTFTAEQTETQIHIWHANPTQTELQNSYFEVEEVTVAEFSVADQMLWVNDWTLQRVTIEKVAAYGFNIQDGDMRKVSIIDCRTRYTGGDAIDFKQRGPSADNYALTLVNFLAEDACLTEDKTAAVDIRGDFKGVNITVRRFGPADFNTTAIRLRTLTSPRAAYGGDAAEGSSITQFCIEGEGRAHGLGSGMGIGSPDVKISQGTIKNCFVGLQTSGNQFGQALNAQVSQVTAIGCGTGFNILADRNRLSQLTSRDCNLGFNRAGDDGDFSQCWDEGSTTPQTTTGPNITGTIGLLAA